MLKCAHVGHIQIPVFWTDDRKWAKNGVISVKEVVKARERGGTSKSSSLLWEQLTQSRRGWPQHLGLTRPDKNPERRGSTSPKSFFSMALGPLTGAGVGVRVL